MHDSHAYLTSRNPLASFIPAILLSMLDSFSTYTLLPSVRSLLHPLLSIPSSNFSSVNDTPTHIIRLPVMTMMIIDDQDDHDHDHDADDDGDDDGLIGPGVR